MAIKKKYQDELVAIIHKHIQPCVIYLFGSRAINREYIGSDIDLALDAGVPIAPRILLAIEMEIDETTIPMKVDLVDLQVAPDELKKDIMREGVLWTN